MPIAPTFSVANQNSNSPKLPTAARLVPQKRTMNSRTHIHEDVAGNQETMMAAAPIASTAMPTHSSTQNIQPAVNPAHGPIARSACTEKVPEAGLAADSSPSIRITSITSRPETA